MSEELASPPEIAHAGYGLLARRVHRRRRAGPLYGFVLSEMRARPRS